MIEVPLSPKQVDAASRLHATVGQWQVTDHALQILSKKMPGWSDEECIVKCITLNSLYGTQVFAILKMADHVKNTFEALPKRGGQGLVERIALLKLSRGKPRHHISFASKLCHIFVSCDRYPIYDDAARDALKMHLGNAYIRDAKMPYKTFCKNLDALRDSVDVTMDYRRLDRYLWIVGLYRRSLKGRAINSELSRILSNPSSEQAAYLDELLPRSLERTFAGRNQIALNRAKRNLGRSVRSEI